MWTTLLTVMYFKIDFAFYGQNFNSLFGKKRED